MSDPDPLIPDALAFFARLGANNNRDWFQSHKAAYEAEVKRPAGALLDVMAAWLTREIGRPVTPKLYRVHRDVRFSKDKTPYHTHLHLQWTDPATGIAHLFGASQNYVCAGVGAFEFPKDRLDIWRKRIAGATGDAFFAETEALVASGHRRDAPALKRVPAPFGQDHPRGAQLKHKGFVLWHDFTPQEVAAPRGALETTFARLGPYRTQLAALLTP